MKFENIDWADSNIDKIEIEYDCAKLLIFNDTLQKNVCVSCTGFVGLTNLCMWDDQIIDDATVHQIQDDDDTPFIKTVFSAYDKDFNYGERWLNKGVLELRIKLINGNGEKMEDSVIDEVEAYLDGAVNVPYASSFEYNYPPYLSVVLFVVILCRTFVRYFFLFFFP